MEEIRILSRANPEVSWYIEPCPWNEEEDRGEHKCAVKSTSICRYFRGISPLDSVLYVYPEKK